jgi:hypothetical protein
VCARVSFVVGQGDAPSSQVTEPGGITENLHCAVANLDCDVAALRRRHDSDSSVVGGDGKHVVCHPTSMAMAELGRGPGGRRVQFER